MIDLMVTPFLILMEMVFLDVLADTFFSGKKSGTRRKRMVGLVILTAVMSVSVHLLQDMFLLKLFFDFLLAYAYLLAFYNTTFWVAVSVYIFHYSMLICIDFIGVSAYYFYVSKASENLVLYYAMCLTIKSVEMGIGFLIRRLWKRGGYVSVCPKEMLVLFPAFGIIIGIGVFVTELLMGTKSAPREITVLMAGIIVLNALLVFYLLLATRSEMEKNRMRDAARQNQMQLELYKNKQELYKKQGKRLHEYKNQLLTIRHMLEQDQAAQTLEYIHSLTGGMAKELDRIYTNHPTVDAVLNMKRQEALNREININFMCGDLKGILLKEEEIIILLGNLLDNAIEAAAKCESDRSIQVRIVQEEQQLAISIKNTCAQPLQRVNGRVMTTKIDDEAHGYGLAAIQDIVQSYDGIFVIKAEGEYVKATVLIPEP